MFLLGNNAVHLLLLLSPANGFSLNCHSYQALTRIGGSCSRSLTRPAKNAANSDGTLPILVPSAFSSAGLLLYQSRSNNDMEENNDNNNKDDEMSSNNESQVVERNNNNKPPAQTQNGGNSSEQQEQELQDFLDRPFFVPEKVDDKSPLKWFANLVENDYQTAEALFASLFITGMVIVTQEVLRMQLYGPDNYIPFSKGGGGGGFLF